MSDIKERLDKVRALIQEPEFLEGKGLSNEVNIRIFCYEPENEMVVRHFVNQMETDQSLDCHLKICNLAPNTKFPVTGYLFDSASGTTESCKS